MQIDYTPPPTINRFMLDNSLVRGLIGPFGSGKSVGCAMELLRQATLAPPDQNGIKKTRFVIIRNTFRMLNDTTIKTVFEWIPPEKAGKWLSSRNTFYVKFGNVESEWMFRALDSPDDIRNLLSLEVTAAWINEFREIDPDVFVNLLGRVGRFRPDKKTPAGWSGIIMDSNPPEVDSYFYKLFEEEPPEEVQNLAGKFDRPLLAIYKQPSGLSEEAENVENLPKDYYETLMAVNSDKSREWVNVHVHGKYGYVQTGKPVFPEFSDIHVPERTLKPSPHTSIALGMDFGLTPAAIMVQQNALGQWLVLQELVADNMGIERFITKLIPFLQQVFPDHSWDMKKEVWGDPAGQTRTDTDENTCFKSLRAAGFIVRPGPQDLETRLGSVRRTLNRLIEGKPGILIDRSCKMLLKGFYGRYRYRRMQKSGEYYDEKPDKNETSHPHDALQYVLGAYEGRAIKGQGGRKFGKGGFNKPVIVKPTRKVFQ